jgi:hypothetical protein
MEPDKSDHAADVHGTVRRAGAHVYRVTDADEQEMRKPRAVMTRSGCVADRTRQAAARPAVHVRVLEEAGLVVTPRSGR